MIPNDIEVTHYFSSGTYLKRMTLPANWEVQTHKHTFDHASILAKGKVIVTANGVESEYVAGDCIDIKANIAHKIISIEDSIWFCIHATSETDPDKIDHTLIKED